MTAIDDTQAAPVDPDKLMGFVFKAVEEVGAALNCALVVMGDKPGLLPRSRRRARSTASDLAERTGTGEQYTREWLTAQTAGSLRRDTIRRPAGSPLPPEHAMALTDESSPAFVPGLFQIAHGTVGDAESVIEVARDG